MLGAAAASGASVRDRTAEFQQIVARLQQQQGLPSTSGRDASAAASTGAAQSEFARRAAKIGMGIHSTSQKLQKLAQLARRTSMFDDPAEEINELSTVVKQDIQALNQAISDLQTFSGGGPNKQSADHSHTVVDNLRSRLKDAAKEFKDVLTTRTDNLKAHQERKSMFSAAPEGGAARQPLFSQPGASFLPPNARNPLAPAVRGGLQGGGSDESAPLLGGGGGQQQQALMVPAQDQYLASRAEALHQVESTIVELGGIFQQLAHMVHEQGEMATRIDENVEDTLANVDAGQAQLLKYLSAISSNRFLIMKVFAVLLCFMACSLSLLRSGRPLPSSLPRVGGESRCGGLSSSRVLNRKGSSARRSPVLAASGGSSGGSGGGGGGSRDAPKESQLKLQLQLLGTILVRFPGLYGTLAVAAGYLLHLDPLGGLHWNTHDALLGLKCAVPILLLDAALMLPNYSPGTTTKTIKLKVPRGESSSGSSTSSTAGSAAKQPQAQQQAQQQAAGPPEATATAAAAAPAPAAAAEGQQQREQPDEDLVEIEKKIPVRAKQHPLLAALYRAQMEKAVDNPGRLLAFPLEMVLVLTWHLAEEMLYRGVILTWAVGWTIDRLYEAGADETVSLLGTQLATPQAGALFAAVGCATVSLALLVQRSLFPVRLIQKAEQELAATEERDQRQEERKQALEAAFGMPSKARKQKADDTLKERARMRKVLDKVKVGLVRQRAWSTAIEGTRDVAEWALYSTSYLLTGNLLAPYVTACTSDVLFSFYQRMKARQVEESMQQSLASIRELTNTAAIAAAARKQALAPPAASSKSGGGSSSEVSESAASSNGKSGEEQEEQQQQGEQQQGQQPEAGDGDKEVAAPVGARGSSSSSSSNSSSSKGEE
ncbi:hypothetical protein COHA_002673 [Chlorella ohadii]|uniref:t-SNARE coiled-coil homology domain-containing protein n=1 Tax=Chlorella ohadii TaxID=2649997 RepID=A0AAD5DTK3_9CHLO|nr:hypothetical protein COHA_002673 [Chlorella ohadii]